MNMSGRGPGRNSGFLGRPAFAGFRVSGLGWFRFCFFFFFSAFCSGSAYSRMGFGVSGLGVLDFRFRG